MVAATPVDSYRDRPRIWVETLWLIESIEQEKLIREISLFRGLNLILSEPTKASIGHGVGKTAFCQLIRFVLEDPQWSAGTPLLEELKNAMPDGAVAARVHVGDEAWTVLKPWKHQKQYRASNSASWLQLARNEVANEHSAYVGSLNAALIDPLPVHHLPGSDQEIKWSHILAWISRDQGSRYQSYYHWRTEGSGFALPAQSPVLVMKVVLGLLTDAANHKKLKMKEYELSELKAEISDLSRRPKGLLSHVKHQLSNALGVHDASPFHKTSLFDETTLHGLALQQIELRKSELQSIGAKLEEIENRQIKIYEESADLRSAVETYENQIELLNAEICGNAEEINRIRNEPAALRNQSMKLCVPGNLLYRDCDYINKRISAIELSSIRDARQRAKSLDEGKAEIARLEDSLATIIYELKPFELELSTLKQEKNRLSLHQLDLLGKVSRIQETIDDYEFYENLANNSNQWQEMENLKKKESSLEVEIGNLSVTIQQEEDKYSSRRKTISDVVNQMALQLPDFSWGVFNDGEPHPFHLGPLHSTAYGVLETLAGDLACLMDSTNQQSYHPGFLLHDSPREAEMSEQLFWSLISNANRLRDAPYQYIVTTSTNAPEEYKSNVRLHLHSRNNSGYLFNKKIGIENQPLDLPG